MPVYLKLPCPGHCPTRPQPASCLSICNYHVQAIAPLPASCLSICNYHVHAIVRLHASYLSICQLPFSGPFLAIASCLSSCNMFRPLPGCLLPCLSSCNYTMFRLLPGCMLSCLSSCNYHVQAIAWLPHKAACRPVFYVRVSLQVETCLCNSIDPSPAIGIPLGNIVQIFFRK